MTIKERNAKIMALVNGGSTYQQAADAVGVTRNTVAGVVYRERREFMDELRTKLDRIPEVVLPNFGSPLIIKTPRKGMFGRIADWVMGRA